MTKKLILLLLLISTLCFGQEKYTPGGQVLKVIPHGLGSNRRGTLVDESGNNHNAAIKVPVLNFSATNDSASVAVPWDALGGSRYAVWVGRVYPTAQSAVRWLWNDSWNTDATLAKIVVQIDADDKLRIRVRSGAKTDTLRNSASSSALAEGTWMSLFVAIDLGTDGTVANGFTAYVWVDGLEFTMGAFDGDATQGTWAANVSSYMAFGLSSGDANDFSGKMKWMGYSGMDALPTIEDARQFHNNAQVWFGQAGLDANWPLNESTNNTFLDRSGNDHTLVGAGVNWVIDEASETGVNADTRMGIATIASGYVDLATTAKVAQGTARTSNADGDKTTIVFGTQGWASDFPINTVVENVAEGTWHRITNSVDGGGVTTVTVEPDAANPTSWDNLELTAYKGQLQLLSEDAFAICMWWMPRIASSGFDRYMTASIGATGSTRTRWIRVNDAGRYSFYHAGTVSAAPGSDHTGHTDGLIHSWTTVFDNNIGSGEGDVFSWIDKTDEQQDTSYQGLHGMNADFIRLGADAESGDNGATDTFGQFCLIDLSDITAGVDQEVREGIRDAWDDADMDWEVFFADLLSKFDAWTGPSNGDTITITYWKLLNSVPYGEEIDTDDIISRYTRILTRGSALPVEGAADATDGDTENCTGIPLDTLGDSFTGSRLWMDASYDLDFGDHADFSFDGGGDTPFSYMVWSDASPGTWVQPLLYKASEYLFSVAADGKLRIVLIDAESDTINTTTDAVRADGTLHCWVFTYDGGGVNSGLSIYEDGVVVASTDGGGGAYGDMPNSAFSLLVDGILASHVYNGQLYNHELSANEVKALFDQGPYR